MITVNVICQDCKFKRVGVKLNYNKFKYDKGEQVIQHLKKHPTHTVKIESYHTFAYYKINNDKSIEVINSDDWIG